MDDATFASLTAAAGLAVTASRFSDDVREALATLARHKANLPRSSDATLEPLPAYRAPTCGAR